MFDEISEFCSRCVRKSCVKTMSHFNTEMICPECQEIEKAHPMYFEARRLENEAVKNGNYNYPGIGLPENFHEFAEKYRRKHEKAP